MSDKTFYPTQSYGFARVYLEFYFVTNGSSQPVLSLVDGVGTDVIQSITLGATGTYTVQLSPRDHYNKVIYKTADMDDTAADGAYATVGSVANEGSGTVGISAVVTTRAAAGTATNYTGRKCNVQFAFRNSASGLK